MAKFRQKRFLIPVLIIVILLLLVASFNEYAYHQEAERLYSSGILKIELYDTAIVLGAYVNDDGSITQVGRTRMDKALDLYRERKVAKIIVSGGATNSRVAKSEAKTMYDYALINGLPKADIVMEETAGSTVGNAYYVKINILQANGWHNNIVVTNDFHIVRAKQVFSKVLGKCSATAYLASSQELSITKAITTSLRERVLYLLHTILFFRIKDGDHEQIRSRFEFLRLPIGTPPRPVEQGTLPLSHTWPLMEFSLSDASLL